MKIQLAVNNLYALSFTLFLKIFFFCFFLLDLHPRQNNLATTTLIGGKLQRSDSTTEFTPLSDNKEVEYFYASDASAFIEYTNRVIFLEDDDVATISDGRRFFIY